MSDNVFFQRCKNAAWNALVEISLIQLDIINTFSDNSSEMCHRESKLWSRAGFPVSRDDDEYSESDNDEEDTEDERDFE